MEENEVIVVNSIPENDYDKIIENAVKYAIISIPFTFDRMGIPSLKQKIINISKGKIAEGLFEFFCIHNNIQVNFELCNTPFYQADKRDFILDGNEWDIKNNFLYHMNDLIGNQGYINLPALIPNRGNWDQWSKRGNCAFLFTFLKNLDSYQKNSNFIDINLSPEQERLVRDLYGRYQGQHQNQPPFTEENFWDNFFRASNNLNYSLQHRPFLIITSYANSHHWDLFEDSGTGIHRYCEGILTTIINNKVVNVVNLPSFLSLFPTLRQTINNAYIKN